MATLVSAASKSYTSDSSRKFVTAVETVIPEGVFIYSRTDLKGHITVANEAFAEISGYSIEEMLGKPHNLVRHPDMPKEAFADMWKSLKAGRPWQGTVKNRRKDGGFYWVLANASPIRENGMVVGYQSIRHRPTREQIAGATEAYRRLQAGDRSIKVEEGQVVPALPAWREAISSVEAQLSIGSLATLLAIVVGFIGLWWGQSSSVLRVLAELVFGACGCVALYMLLRFIPRLALDLRVLESYFDRLLSSGNLETRMTTTRRDRVGLIGSKAGLMVGWVQATIQSINDAVQHLQRVADEVHDGVGDIEQAANSQNVATSSVAAGVEEMSMSIREVFDNLHTTEATVSESGKRASEGAQISEHASKQIENLAHTVKDAAREVEALGRSSAEVGAIAAAIREIADQTNLLALNASIEAARAGDAGRGFGVVATEVRNLADRTMKATEKIDTLIVTIKTDSGRAVASMRTGAGQVEESVSLVRQAQETLHEIDQLMSDAVRKVSEISVASTQQTGAMTDIGSNAAQVAKMTEQNVDVVRKTTDSMTFFRSMVDQVQRAVTQYRV